MSGGRKAHQVFDCIIGIVVIFRFAISQNQQSSRMWRLGAFSGRSLGGYQDSFVQGFHRRGKPRIVRTSRCGVSIFSLRSEALRDTITASRTRMPSAGSVPSRDGRGKAGKIKWTEVTAAQLLARPDPRVNHRTSHVLTSGFPLRATTELAHRRPPEISMSPPASFVNTLGAQLIKAWRDSPAPTSLLPVRSPYSSIWLVPAPP